MTNTESGGQKTFGDRYEITSKIARGGMADVFLARDKLLDRPVALKVLFPELSVDPSFVERFRREAQNAAKLSHPNIVPVYDWGEDNNTYYIVMEYVDGKSLSTILRDEGRLSADRAARIGCEVASALSFAHRNGVVHRDVKPGNVLIDERGSVKVTDFGIARARNATENLTQTGAVMGTATYFSPEQAQGLAVDQRSDVYSLGVVLYELVAGKPPFQGDNPVTIAYKHVREQPQRLRQVDSSTPPAFEAIVMEAMAKSPSNRYATAEDLRADLERFRTGRAIKATAVAPPETGYRTAEQAYADSTRTIPSAPPPPPTSRRPPREGNVAGPLAAFVALLAVLAIGVMLLFTENPLTKAHEKTVTVPAVVGKSLTDAQAALSALKLKWSIAHQANDAAINTVVAQDPASPASARQGDTVRLTVSDGPTPIALRDYSGQAADAATKALQKLGYNVATTQATSDTVEKGKVISQDPPVGTPLAKGETVTLTISTGPQQVEVPNVVGFTQSRAAQELSDSGLRTNAVNKDSDQPQGTVLSSDPAAGTSVPKGTTVTITVSSGTSPTTGSTESTTITTPGTVTAGKQ